RATGLCTLISRSIPSRNVLSRGSAALRTPFRVALLVRELHQRQTSPSRPLEGGTRRLHLGIVVAGQRWCTVPSADKYRSPAKKSRTLLRCSQYAHTSHSQNGDGTASRDRQRP